MITMIAAPARVLGQYSTKCGVLLIAFNAGAAILALLAADHSLTLTQVALGNVILGALTESTKLIQQQIPATAEQKIDIVTRAADLPVTKGEIDPGITIEVAHPTTVKGNL